MIDLQFVQDESGVWDIPTDGINEPATIEDRAALGQHLRHRLLTFLGEWFLDTGVGVPYFQKILKKGVPLSSIEAILKKTINDTPKVTKLVGFEMTYSNETRRLTVSFAADSIYGRLLERIEL